MPFADKMLHYQQMIGLIRRKATGSPKEFAEKLRVSKATLYRHLDELKAIESDIKYNTHRRSFEFSAQEKK